ncbi:MAG: hypothetical protein DMD99_11985 [Candidatus Rokuibacteriota bacterium]|nr:MAG: hypothetical protein DMD99_11985 [Candidatus Rokubacteria bacterium]
MDGPLLVQGSEQPAERGVHGLEEGETEFIGDDERVEALGGRNDSTPGLRDVAPTVLGSQHDAACADQAVRGEVAFQK